MDNEEKTSIRERILTIIFSAFSFAVAIWGISTSVNDSFALMLWSYLAALDVYILGREIYHLGKNAKKDSGAIDGMSRRENEDGKEEE
jgi:hypothetical protein